MWLSLGDWKPSYDRSLTTSKWNMTPVHNLMIATNQLKGITIWDSPKYIGILFNCNPWVLQMQPSQVLRFQAVETKNHQGLFLLSFANLPNGFTKPSVMRNGDPPWHARDAYVTLWVHTHRCARPCIAMWLELQIDCRHWWLQRIFRVAVSL